jgi:anti-sigma-K factor RskA
MNNDLDEAQLENLLRGLAPAAASPALRHRVDEELKLDMSWLSTRPKSQRLPRWVTSASWAAMGAAAAIAVMSYMPQPQAASAVAAVTPAAEPAVTTAHEFDEARDTGVYHSRNRSNEKRALVISRELQTWVDPRYAAETSLDIPTQSQLFLPASFR